MKKLPLLCTGVLFTCLLAAQPSFQTTLEAGISLPLNSNSTDETHAGKAIHFGSHYDYSFGSGAVKIGLGAYIGYLNSLSADGKYKETGSSIAEKYRFSATNLSFNSTDFKSTQVLLGPIASFGSGKCSVNIWAKAGYGFNEPSRYAVLYKENGATNNIYVNQSGEHTNGLAYTAGAGIRCAISEYVAFKMSANYFSSQTDQVNYNFDREKGIAPKYYTAANQFIQASAGLQFSIGNVDKKVKTTRNSYSIVSDTGSPVAKGQKIKTKSNIKNDRLMNNAGNETGDNPDNDSLYFSPEKIELRSIVSNPGMNRMPLQSVDNYLTGFVYQTLNGATISQCGASAMPGEPIPGIDVRLRRADATTGDVMTTRTNRDGSFAFNNTPPGNYRAEAANNTMDVVVKSNKEDVFKILDIYGGSCGATKENYVLNADDKTYVEIINTKPADSSSATKKHIANIKWSDAKVSSPRDAASGMATGKRMHKPYRVSDTEFDVNMDNIVSNDGKLYAEVLSSREASSGMATGRRTLITGDVDGDGIAENEIVSPRDPASGLPTGKRMHKPMVITTEVGRWSGHDLDSDNDEYTDNEIVSPRDAASGMAAGRRMHKPYVITKELNLIEEDANEIATPRDAASGMATGKRMHKPFVITVEAEASNGIVSPRDASPGMSTGRRQYKPILIRINPEENSYSILSPRDASSGMATGKRMHKPFVITKELGYTAEGDETEQYKIVWGDPREYVDGVTETEKPAGERLSKKGYDYYPPLANENMEQGVVENPLYQGGGNSGTNPMFESKEALHVNGGSGKGHDIFIPSNLIIVRPVNDPPLAAYSNYAVGPIKWMTPESMAQRKGITEKGIKKNEAMERKGWDGSVKGSGKNINTSEDNLASNKINAGLTGSEAGKSINTKGVRRTDVSERKGWDGTVKGGSIVTEISRVNCAAGTCTVEALVETDGVIYEAVISGVMKTKHDTVKNSIGNIR